MQGTVLLRKFFLGALMVGTAVGGLLAYRNLIAASEPQDPLRLTPAAITLQYGKIVPVPGVASPERIPFDRSTRVALTSSGEIGLVTTLSTPSEIQAIKVYGAARFRLTVKADRDGNWDAIAGLTDLDLSSLTEDWHRLPASIPVTTGKLLFVLTPVSGSSAPGLRELEIWSSGYRLVHKTGFDLLAAMQSPEPPQNGRLYPASPAGSSEIKDGAPATFSWSLPPATSDIKRAWLVYELQGAGHWISTVRQVNGKLPLGGQWRFASSAWSQQMEPVDPSWLVSGTNSVSFSAPDSDSSYAVRNVQFLVELDDGSNFVSEVQATPNSAVNTAYSVRDGDPTTGWSPYPSDVHSSVTPSLTLLFDKPTTLEGVALDMVNTFGGKIEVSFLENGAWANAGIGAIVGQKLGAGWNQLPIYSKSPIDGIRLDFMNGEGSAAEILEVVPWGSGVGYTHGPYITLGYPDAGQYYGRTAYLRGFVAPYDNGSGPVKITAADKVIGNNDGAYEGLITKDEAGFGDSADSDPWSVTIVATWPDGKKLTRVVNFTQYGEEATTKGALKANPSTWARSATSQGPRILPVVDPFLLEHDGATLELDPDAMKEAPSTLSITSLRERDLPPLDPGMTNVTRGPRAGYRFLPHGKHFKKKVRLSLPYDKNKLPPGMTEADIRTYYYDTDIGHWRALERAQVDTQKQRIHSLTTHFTDMINATLVVPEHPQATSFNPTQIKDIKAADPGAGINLIEPPKANNQGNANLSYPIEIPPGRHGMQPQLAVQYSSGGGNGWLGLGWDLSVPMIALDTRWGVPRFDATKESETYVLNGEQLTPLAHRTAWEALPNRNSADGSTKEFHTRVEGAFKKIIRHGTKPTTYWWEVVDKNGTRHFYGGINEKDTNGKLRGPNGIAKWMLRRSVDTYGNTVTYQYATVCDTGTGDGHNANRDAVCEGEGIAPGYQLYLSAIHYTGSKTDKGAYKVTFVRQAARRPDIIIDGRSGLKQVTADRLGRIDVTFNGTLVRRYKLNYGEGAFHKTLLKSIVQFGKDGVTEFNRHTFKYYDDARTADGKYKGFSTTGRDWSIGSDGIDGCNEVAKALGIQVASALGATCSTNDGAHFYAGGGTIHEPVTSKKSSAGGKVGSSDTTNETLITLADMDGDGLPDKVFKKDGKYFYRPNLSGPKGAHGFGDAVSLSDGATGLPGIAEEEVTSDTYGAETYGEDVGILVDHNHAITTSRLYFADVNGDGITDVVDNGRVRFGYVSGNRPRYTDNSGETPVAVGHGAVDAADLLSFDDDVTKTRQAKYPLVDTVRRWVAPYDGTVQITAPVRLIEQDPNYRSASGQPADGVRVAIEHEGAEVWSGSLTAANPSAEGVVKSVPVQRGDNLYFRVQSVDDGNYDRVEWDPEIVYVGKDLTRTDVNGLTVYRYQASQDFTLAGRPGTSLAPATGTLHLGGTLTKTANLTDDVDFVFLVNAKEVYRYRLGQATPISADIGVQKSDKLEWRLRVDSPIDVNKVRFTPRAYYTVVDGIPKTITLDAPYDMDLYPLETTGAPQQPYVVPKGTDTVQASASFTVAPLPLGLTTQAVLTVKRRGELLAKKVFDIVGQGTDGTQLPMTFSLSERLKVTEGDELFFDLSSRDPNFHTYLQDDGASVGLLAPVQLVLHQRAPDAPPVIGFLSGVPASWAAFGYRLNGWHYMATTARGLLPQWYRGWAAFAYNGDGKRATQPIDQTVLFIDKDYSLDTARVYPFTVTKDPRDPGARDPSQPYADFSLWGGVDDKHWVKGGQMSSSRLMMADISLPSAGQFAGASAPPRISESNSDSAELGGVSPSKGTSKSLIDFLDLNGDRFPDVVRQGSVQYSDMVGGPGYKIGGRQLSSARSNDNESFGLSTSSGSIAVAIAGARGNVTPDGHSSSPSAKQGSDMPDFSANVGTGTSDAKYDLIDMNGDGLPDIVKDDGTVALNLGYVFGPAEQWEGGDLNAGESVDVGLSASFLAGYNKDSYSLAFGLSGGVGESRTNSTYVDINGDGLPDKLTYVRDEKTTGPRMWVQLNTGAGFKAPMVWNGGFEDLSVDQHLTVGGGTYLTYGSAIPPCCRVIFNGGISKSYSLGRPEYAFRDMDGDGYVDQVFSDSESKLEVALNPIGRTNLLKRIERPLGATIDIDYTRDGNTYDLPSSRWVMSKVTVFDGFKGDGVDRLINTYVYAKPHYDRNEREFYGYAQVTEEQRDASKSEASNLYRKVYSEYLTDSYYHKGLLSKQELQDASGNWYTRTVNTYALRDPDGQGGDGASTTATLFPALIRTDNAFREANGGTTSTYSTFDYDAYGNVSAYFDAGESDSDKDDVSATITYTDCDGKYIVGTPRKMVVKDAFGHELRRRDAVVDCHDGSIDSISQYLETGEASTTSLTYDDFGNLATVTAPPNDRRHPDIRYTLAYTYDTTVHTYIEGIEDNTFGTLGDLSASAKYDYAFGHLTETTDVNGNRITYAYDDFGRMTKVFGPYEAGGDTPTIRFEYRPTANPPLAITHHLDTYRPDTLDTWLFTDGLKRVLQTKKDAAIARGDGTDDDTRIVSGRVVFDGLGRTVKQYYPLADSGANDEFLPTFNKVEPTETAYDIQDRPTRTTFPDGTATKTRYAIAGERFETKVIDPLQHVRKSYHDVRQLIRKVVENDGTQDIVTRYQYDPLKEITKVIDARQHVTHVTYDNLGRRTAIDNPDTGKVEFAYDPASHLIGKVTPKLRERGTAITYDYEFNRLVAIKHDANNPDNHHIDVTYTYGRDTDRNRKDGRVGRIVHVTHQGGYEDRWYGKLGEVTKEQKTVMVPVDRYPSGHKFNQGETQPVTAEVFTTQYTYDSFGRLHKLIYPDGEVLTYTYNSGGLPTSVHGSYKGAPYDYVKYLGYDTFEQRVQLKLGNGAESDYTYDPTMRRLSHLDTTSLGNHFQNLSYTYDAVGNITDLLNQVAIPAPSFTGYSKKHFDYDPLYRLVHAEGVYQKDVDSKEQFSLDMHYDVIHNITEKNQVDQVVSLPGGSQGTRHATTYDWSYRYTGPQPHAPTHIGLLTDAKTDTIVGRTFGYDKDGNQLGWTDDKNANTRKIVWDDEDRIQSIDDQGGEFSQYSYDDAGQRVIKQAKTGVTVYVNQFFTERNGSIGSKHIFVGNTRIVTKVTGGTDFIRSYDGVTGAKTTPKRITTGPVSDKGNNGKSDHSDNGNHYGQLQDKSNNGNHYGQLNDKGNGQSKSGDNTVDSFPGQGLEHRSDRANEVAQNTCKNKHLVGFGLCDSDKDGTPDAQEGGTGGDGAIIDPGTDAGSGTTQPTSGEVVKISTGEQLFYYHADHLGSTGWVTRENGELHEAIEYFPFGETWVHQGGNTERSPYLFTSKELDEETGLYYYGARYYDPRTSVWQSADPILANYLNNGVFDPRNLSLYAYAHENPVMMTDPDGNAVFAFEFNRHSQYGTWALVWNGWMPDGVFRVTSRRDGDGQGIRSGWYNYRVGTHPYAGGASNHGYTDDGQAIRGLNVFDGDSRTLPALPYKIDGTKSSKKSFEGINAHVGNMVRYSNGEVANRSNRVRTGGDGCIVVPWTTDAKPKMPDGWKHTPSVWSNYQDFMSSFKDGDRGALILIRPGETGNWFREKYDISSKWVRSNYDKMEKWVHQKVE